MRPGDLKSALGVSQAYWAFIESGKRRTPERLFRKLARVLDLPVTALPLEDPGNWTPDSIASTLAGLARLVREEALGRAPVSDKERT